MIKYLLIILFIPLILFSQETEEENIWQPLDFLIGSWIGDETGKAGIGKGERTYEYIMNKKYIKMQNTSKFEPQEKNPNGETHEDLTIFSRDNSRNLIIVRQFNIEGYVNTFVLDTTKSDNRNLIFISELTENSPKGLKARLTYKINNKDEFTELFELALPGKEFEIWLRNFWRRSIN
jgi:hypothetical protein